MDALLEAPDAVTQLAMEFGPRLLSATLVLVAGLFVTRWAAGLAGRGLARFPLEPPVRELLLRVVRLLVFLVFLLMALQNLGIDLLPLIAGLGIAGAGIALALQGVLGNVAAGLTIIFTRPFRVGEYISIAGEILHNYGEIRQLNLRVGVAYATDLDTAFAAIREVLAANPRVLKDPAPVVQAAALGEFAISIAIQPWVAVRDFVAAPGEINTAVVREFRERGITMPVPVVRAIA
jgi:small conductance mechanosensitive channel